MSGGPRDKVRGAGIAALAWLLCDGLALSPPARAAYGEATTVTLAAAPSDSVPAPTASSQAGAVKPAPAGVAASDSLDAAADSVSGETPPPVTDPFIATWTQTPTARLSSGVRTVRCDAGLASEMVLRNLSTLNATFGWSLEDYRQQDKTVEARNGSLSFSDMSGPRFHKALSLTRNWSEDRTVNTAGNANINRLDFSQALATVDSLIANTGAVRHALRLGGRLDDQKQSSLGIPNDFRERLGSAGLSSRYRPARGVVVVTSAYGERSGGNRTLGSETSSSSASGDTLGAFVGYTRRLLTGSVSARLANFDRRYLDYRRNANGIIDTLGAVQKIVQELEQNDALALEWRNTATGAV